MNDRLSLHAELVNILGSSYVYFQPPEDIKLNYPCIIYHMSGMPAPHADDHPYILNDRYTITVIDSDPLSTIKRDVARLPSAAFDRHFKNGGLNHDVFNIHL